MMDKYYYGEVKTAHYIMHKYKIKNTLTTRSENGVPLI